MKSLLKLFKKSMRKKSRGSIVVLSLIFMLITLLGASLFININFTNEMYNRVENAAEEGARTRALSVDTHLLEASGYAKVFHENSPAYEDVVDHHEWTDTPGHVSPKLPSQFQRENRHADEVAKTAIISYLDSALATNTAGDDILTDFDEGNICIDVFPLPEFEDANNSRTLSCNTDLGPVIAEDINISSVEENTYGIYEHDDSDDVDEIKVVNAIFIGISFEHTHFLESVLDYMGWEVSTNKQAWAIAYPSIDRCYHGANFCYEEPIVETG